MVLREVRYGTCNGYVDIQMNDMEWIASNMFVYIILYVYKPST